MHKIILFLYQAVKLGILKYPFWAFMSKVSISGIKQKQTLIRNYLTKNYLPLIMELDKKYKGEVEEAEKIVWVYWKQGIENAPDIVKICVNSMCQNIEGAKIILLSDANLSQFITIEKHILDAVHTGRITPTHFSDIVRVKLLKKYGGLWLDSTIFVPNKVNFSDLVYSPQGIFTLTEAPHKGNIYIPNGKWTGFCFGANKKNLAIFSILDELFVSYWGRENYLIDYFLIDYFIEMIYQYLNLDVNDINKYGDSLFSIINESFDESLYLQYSRNVMFHKFSYKIPLIEKKDNQLTFWGYIKAQYFTKKI